MLTFIRRRSIARTAAAVLTTLVLTTMALPASAEQPGGGYLTEDESFITLDAALPSGAVVVPIVSSGETVDGVLFEGLPDGIGIRPGFDRNTAEVYVAHENTEIPFRGSRDFVASSVTHLTIDTNGPDRGSVLAADIALSSDDGFQRFCSASIAGPAEGLDDYVFFTGEETSDFLDGEQRGYAVVLNTDTGESTAVPGMGRLNHENTVVVPGAWDGLAMVTTDDTFAAPSSQLYMYRADDQDALFADEGELFALRVTGVNGTTVDAADPFNNANDYLDVAVGDTATAEFIPVPREIALGDQTVLEDWSNDNNVFQAIRLEDAAVDKNQSNVVYIADTGATRVNPDPATGRLIRGPSGTVGQTDNGRVWKLVFDPTDPTSIIEMSVYADGDAVGTDAYVPFRSPDNLDTSKKSLMIQEDASDAKIWQHSFDDGWWREVAQVNDPRGESSGIVDASDAFGGGWWLLNVQAHGSNVDEDTTTIPGITLKRESGQLILMKIPGS